jgi:RimJ/RimL family protein N-acetyltransferase
VRRKHAFQYRFSEIGYSAGVSGRVVVELAFAGSKLRAYEPTAEEVATAAPLLLAYYNDPHNRAMLAHEADLVLADVAEHYERVAEGRGRAFLLEADGLLVGDADLRGVDMTGSAGGVAELAILVGARAAQGRGLGTRFGVMLHAFAFHALGLERVYASIIPANTPSLRLFQRLGYERDDSPAARRTADAPDDVTLSLAAARFDELHGALAGEVEIARRGSVAQKP